MFLPLHVLTLGFLESAARTANYSSNMRRMSNLTLRDAKALAIITPALLGPDFFKEAAAIVNAGGPPDVEKLKAVMAKHGLVPAMSQGVSR